jgi:hypothetical protein
MLVSYSAQEGIQAAVVKTFDGKHPCKLCHFVSEGKQTEKKRDQAQQNLKKFDLLLVTVGEFNFHQEKLFASLEIYPQCATRVYPPLRPPPDLA